MKLGSLFSGIEGFGLGFERAGFKIQWQVEHEAFCKKVLRTHWPNVPRFHDVCAVGSRNLTPVDCITAGVPCQDVSVAGKRAGLAGKRTGLFYEFARILRELRPAWFVFENVPGLLSSNHGRDFAEIQRVLMVECGYGICWRVLDSRYFGVAQRRRRVFIVGCFGKPCPPQILFEPTRSGWDLAAIREARAHVAASLTSGTGSTSNAPGRRREDDHNIVQQAISSKWAKGSSGPAGDEHHNLIATLRSEYGEQAFRGDGSDPLVAATIPADRRLLTDGNRDNLQVAYALREDPGGIGQGHNTTYAITENMRNRSQGPGNYIVNALSPVRGGADDNDAQANHIVSVHTPRIGRDGEHSDGNGNSGIPEMPRTGIDGEQLNDDCDGRNIRTPLDADGMRDFAGLPEGMDSARYRALGNAVTVQVAQWIAQRIIAHQNLAQ